VASHSQSMSDFGKCGNLFGDMKHPSMSDMEAFVAATRLNLATLTATDRIVRESARVVARRHMEIVQQSMAEVTGAMRTMASHEPPQANGAKLDELLKASERGASGMRELSDLIQHSNDKAVTLLNDRVDALSNTLFVTHNIADHLILQTPA
jgi:phasin family protein